MLSEPLLMLLLLFVAAQLRQSSTLLGASSSALRTSTWSTEVYLLQVRAHSAAVLALDHVELRQLIELNLRKSGGCRIKLMLLLILLLRLIHHVDILYCHWCIRLN